MKPLKEYLLRIVDSSKAIDPYKIILFDSVAQGNEGEYSDIDLVIILNEERIPATYDEKLEKKIMVRETILDISMEIPIDLLVFSRGEFTKLGKTNKPFMAEIEEKGIVLYERAG